PAADTFPTRLSSDLVSFHAALQQAPRRPRAAPFLPGPKPTKAAFPRGLRVLLAGVTHCGGHSMEALARAFPHEESGDEIESGTHIPAREFKVYTNRQLDRIRQLQRLSEAQRLDRKSTRLNSSHVKISYAVFCLKKKKRPHLY